MQNLYQATGDYENRSLLLERSKPNLFFRFNETFIKSKFPYSLHILQAIKTR